MNSAILSALGSIMQNASPAPTGVNNATNGVTNAVDPGASQANMGTNLVQHMTGGVSPSTGAPMPKGGATDPAAMAQMVMSMLPAFMGGSAGQNQTPQPVSETHTTQYDDGTKETRSLQKGQSSSSQGSSQGQNSGGDPTAKMLSSLPFGVGDMISKVIASQSGQTQPSGNYSVPMPGGAPGGNGGPDVNPDRVGTGATYGGPPAGTGTGGIGQTVDQFSQMISDLSNKAAAHVKAGQDYLDQAGAAEKGAYGEKVPGPITKGPTLLQALPTVLLSLLAGPQGGNVAASAVNAFMQRRGQVEQAQAQQHQQNIQGAVQQAGILGQKAQNEFSQAQQATQMMEAATHAKAQMDVQQLIQQGKMSVAQFKDLMSLPPEARAGYAQRFLGISDAATLNGLGSLTPKETEQLSQGGYYDAHGNYFNTVAQPMADKLTGQARVANSVADYNIASEQTRIDNLLKVGKLDDARTYLAQQSGLAQGARAGLIQNESSWYGKDMASKIAARTTDANAAMRRANASMATVFQKYQAGGGGKSVTPTAYLQATRTATFAMDKADTATAQLQNELDSATKRYKDLQTGAAKPDPTNPQEMAHLQALIRGDTAQIAGYKVLSGRMQTRLGQINDFVKGSGAAGAQDNFATDRAQGLALMQQHPEKAAQIQARFEKQYGVPIDFDSNASQTATQNSTPF